MNMLNIQRNFKTEVTYIQVQWKVPQ